MYSTKAVEHMHIAQRRVLALTSLWALAACNARAAPALSASLCAAAAASLLFWWDGRFGTRLHAADRACAWIVAVQLAWTSDAWRWAPAVALLYGTSCSLEGTAQFLAHLAFRFVFFWWAFATAHGAPRAATAFPTLSLVYWVTAVTPAMIAT